MSFEYVMSIGTKGSGEGQFKYVEDFALSIDGHLLASDAALLEGMFILDGVSVLERTRTILQQQPNTTHCDAGVQPSEWSEREIPWLAT